MRRTAWVLAVMVMATGCHSGSAMVVGGMSLAFGGGGVATVAANNADTRALGITSIVVGTYLMLAAVVLEERALERSWTPSSGDSSSGGGTAATSCDPCGSSGFGDGASSAAAQPGTAAEVEAQRSMSHSGYDRTGAYAGRVDETGSYYDRTGAYAGRVDTTGSYYDRTGAAAGRVDNSGSVYDRTGASAGRVDSSGSIYDRTGASAGRIDADGSIYDRTGAYAGRVDGACDEQCRRETAGRILTAP